MDDSEKLKHKAEYQRAWVSKNRERVSAWRKARRNGANRDKILSEKRASYLKNKEKVLAYQRQYRMANSIKIAAREKKSREDNPYLTKQKKNEDYRKHWAKRRATSERWKKDNPEWRKQWESENKEKMRTWNREYSRTRRKSDPSFRAAASMRTRVWELLKKAGAKKIVSVGLESEKLKLHLEGKFKEGMTWANYGSEWHVDHIKPCASFDLTSPDQLLICFSYDNLQPLWALENIKKGCKI